MKVLFNKYMQLSGAIACCILATASFANPICTKTGPITVCGKGTLNHLHVAGKATLDGTTVLGTTEIAGMLSAREVNLNTFKVSGKATLHHSQIKGVSKISGMLSAYDTKFHQKLYLSSDLTYLDDTYTRDIEINRGGNKQVLCLKHHSVVDGNILFTTNHGVIIMDSSSKIKGQVRGGYIKQSDFNNNCKGENTND